MKTRKGINPVTRLSIVRIEIMKYQTIHLSKYFSFEYDSNETLSQLFIATDDNCTAQVVYRLDSGNPKCECGVGCLDRHYVKQLSIATWPSNQYLVSFRYISHNH